jgi:hypothetical protein
MLVGAKKDLRCMAEGPTDYRETRWWERRRYRSLICCRSDKGSVIHLCRPPETCNVNHGTREEGVRRYPSSSANLLGRFDVSIVMATCMYSNIPPPAVSVSVGPQVAFGCCKCNTMSSPYWAGRVTNGPVDPCCPHIQVSVWLNPSTTRNQQLRPASKKQASRAATMGPLVAGLSGSKGRGGKKQPTGSKFYIK